MNRKIAKCIILFLGAGMKVTRYAAAVALIVAALTFLGEKVYAQFSVDQRLYGTWSKDGTGEVLKILPNGDVNIFLNGQASVFNGDGAIERCTDGGANLCISGIRMQCAYRYAFTQGVLNLQYRTGTVDLACKALSGDFRRRE